MVRSSPRQRALISIVTVLLVALAMPAAALAAAPVASNSSLYTLDSTPAIITLPATDADLDGLTFAIDAGPSHGLLDDCTTGSCTYTPTASYLGGDSFTWHANDGVTDSNIATVTITIAAPSVTPVSSDSTGADTLAAAMMANPAAVTGASFVAVPPNNMPNGTSTALGPMPTNGTTFGIMTSGEAALADDPNNDGGATGDDGGAPVRGDTDQDVSILKIDVTVPAGANCLRLDFAFMSEEYPEFVNSPYNDGFIAELDTLSWTTSGSDITAPNNFAFDTAGAVISINSTGATGMTAANAAGTTYDGATALLQASTPTTAGAHSLYLSIFDQGDGVLDSAAFIDNIRFATVANPAIGCAEGAQPPNTPPTSDAGGPYGGAEGASVTLDGTATDVDATDTLTYLWSYAAGAGVDAGATCTFGSATSIDTTVSCTDDGLYTLTLAVSDGFNTPATTDTASLTLTNANPAVDITTPTAGQDFNVGASVSVSAGITDAGANDTHTCSIAWGDGNTTTGVVATGVCTGSHSYSAAGPLTITVTVTDDDGGIGSDTVAIDVVATGANTPPTSDAGGPYQGAEGSAISLNGTATDVDAGDTLTYLWSYGAGAAVDTGATCTFGSA
ncbi:MAG: hypothetical protein QOK14_252, partial [Frankiaceae bacterium]|nr:hypothetical protein [Frankiaceae bacterium]